jgi:flagellar motor switch protein FliM
MDSHQATVDSSRRQLSAAFSDGLGRFEKLPLLAKILEESMEDAGRTCGAIVPGASFRLGSVVAGRIQDKLPQVHAKGLIALLRSSKDATAVVVFTSAEFSDALVEAALGGGTAGVRSASDRRPGAIEMGIVKIFLEAFAEAASGAFGRAGIDLKFRVEAVTPELAAVAVMRENVPAFIVAMEVGFAGAKLDMHLMLPQPFIAPLRKALSMAPAPARASPGARHDPAWSQRIESEIKATEVTVTAVLEERVVPLHLIASMKVGDVLPLNFVAGGRSRIETSQLPLFWAELGKQGGRLMLRLDRPIDRDREFINGLIGVGNERWKR